MKSEQSNDTGSRVKWGAYRESRERGLEQILWRACTLEYEKACLYVYVSVYESCSGGWHVMTTEALGDKVKLCNTQK